MSDGKIKNLRIISIAVLSSAVVVGTVTGLINTCDETLTDRLEYELMNEVLDDFDNRTLRRYNVYYYKENDQIKTSLDYVDNNIINDDVALFYMQKKVDNKTLNFVSNNPNRNNATIICPCEDQKIYACKIDDKIIIDDLKNIVSLIKGKENFEFLGLCDEGVVDKYKIGIENDQIKESLDKLNNRLDNINRQKIKK